MRRWNGWGDATHEAELAPVARTLLEQRLGPGRRIVDAPLERILTTLPESRLRGLADADREAATRLFHAHGQSLPDWLSLRYGRIDAVADAVVRPKNHQHAVDALRMAQRLGAEVVPYGGGTSVAGHLSISRTDRPVVNISLEKMTALLEVDEGSGLARFEAGASGPQIESRLSAYGMTLGHFPQSWAYSTLGGWVMTRSCGQQSLRYGRIEQLFDAGRMITPRGEWRVGGTPASAAGPDLRHLMLGSEGRIGLLTEAVVRVRPRPEQEDFHAVFFPSWQAGLKAVREMVLAELPLSMLRLGNATETETQLALADDTAAVKWLRRYLRLRGIEDRPVMLIMGVTGRHRQVLRCRRDALAVARQAHGVHVGRRIGRSWAAQRFSGPYLRNALWSLGYAADAVETAVDWPQATRSVQHIEQALGAALAEENERSHVFTHLSHVYPQGCSMYTTFIYRLAGDYDHDLARWQRLKRAACEAIVTCGGTISHQHGVGLDHAPYLHAEKGTLGLDLLRATLHEMDPQGMMNPGKLLSGNWT